MCYFFSKISQKTIGKEELSDLHEFVVETQNQLDDWQEDEGVGGARTVYGATDIQPIQLAGSYRCWFVKKYCWLVCVREKYCFG